MPVSYSGTAITWPDNSTTTSGWTGFKNRIINGAMMIDQRNAGASGTSGGYTVDRWSYNAAQASKITWQQNAGSVTPPAGFINYLGATSSSAYSVGSSEYFGFEQNIEGLNLSDLGWGTANAATVTLSFWVRSSLTGTFGGVIQNNDNDRTYPFSYTISSANTWEQKTVTIAGDTTGTWLTTNGTGLKLRMSLGTGSSLLTTAGAWVAGNYRGVTGQTNVLGTNGATFYITGVQLERGSTASSFEYRPYGTELGLCYRYFYKLYMTNYGLGCFNENSAGTMGAWLFSTTMRSAPTLGTTGTASDYAIRVPGAVVTCNAVPTLDSNSITSARIVGSTSGGLTVGQGCVLYSPTNQYLTLSAEL
jgi:hypothetical protein